MDGKTKTQLLNLYAQKGEIVTTIEILQSQLQAVNQQIIKLKNEDVKQPKPEKKTKEKKKLDE